MTKKKVDLSLKKQKELLKDVEGIAAAVGIKLLKKQRKLEKLTITSKEAQGVVSEADVEAEDQLITRLRPLLKEADFLAEESAYVKFGGKHEAFKEFKKKEFVWIIDPLDGTTNYLSNMDYYGVCICLAHFGKPLLGLVHRPRTGETYTAIKGQGAFLASATGKRSRLSLPGTQKKLKESLTVTGFASEKGEQFDNEFSAFIEMMRACRGVRRMGSAALDMCLVAEGVFDAFWERGLAPWDVAAAGLICEEAGGKVTNYQGQVFDPFDDTITATRKSVHKEVTTILKD